MTFLKGIFYMKTFDRYSRVPNEDARALLVGDKEQYLRKVMKCVQDSMGRIYDAPPPGCLLAFTEPKPAHYALRLNIIGVDNSEGDGTRSTSDSLRDQFYDASNDVSYFDLSRTSASSLQYYLLSIIPNHIQSQL